VGGARGHVVHMNIIWESDFLGKREGKEGRRGKKEVAVRWREKVKGY